MKNLIFKTDTNNIAYFILRVILGLVILPHGLQKLFGGVFGGFGFEGTMTYFTETVGMPWLLGLLVIAGETFGSLMLVAGFVSRFVAASLMAIMAGAASVHLSNGFFMNWFGNQKGEGYEYFILAAAMSLIITLKGAGRWSVDGYIAQSGFEKNKSPLNEKYATTA